MRLRAPPDWAVYFAAVAAITALALLKQEHADAPPAPPPLADEGASLSLSPALRASQVRRLPGAARARRSGTAFSVSDAGVWLTARHVVMGCRRVAILVAPGRGVTATVAKTPGLEVAVLRSEGGAPALPLVPAGSIHTGQRGFHPGFPRGRPGEAASRLLGPYRLRASRRQERSPRVLAWAEVGRTDGLQGLEGLSGAPVLDARGRVVGVTLAESPRRGRIYASTPEAVRAALAGAGQAPPSYAEGQAVDKDNYGRAGDALRRDLRVAPVVCLD